MLCFGLYFGMELCNVQLQPLTARLLSDSAIAGILKELGQGMEDIMPGGGMTASRIRVRFLVADSRNWDCLREVAELLSKVK